MKIVMIGGNTKPKYLGEYPYDEWEWWGLNAIRPTWAEDVQWARWFNLHRVEHLIRDWSDGLEKERKWANKNTDVPFYVIGEDWKELIPHAIEFPIGDIAQLPRGGKYHAGSFDMLMAFAATLNPTVIALHGIGLNLESGEPISARACMEYWCGVAAARGANITTAKDCDLFHQYHLVKSDTVYGYDDVKLVEDKTCESQ